MTLIVALGCTDGIVMGADSASSDTISGTKQPVIKIERLGDASILCGGSGDVGLIQKILEELTSIKIPNAPKFKNVRQALKRACLPDMKDARDSHIALPVQNYNLPPTATLLFSCIHHGVPYVLEVEIDGRDTVYDKNYGFFTAIGSGKALAQAVMRPHLTRERDMQLGKLLAYRVLEDSIELAASGLAMPIHLYTLDLAGTVTELPGKELAELQDLCNLWRELEREALGRLLAPPEAAVSSEIPEPTETEPSPLIPPKAL